MNDSTTHPTPPLSVPTILGGAGTTPYLPPCITVIEIGVEQGFAGSSTTSGFGDSDGL